MQVHIGFFCEKQVGCTVRGQVGVRIHIHLCTRCMWSRKYVFMGTLKCAQLDSHVLLCRHVCKDVLILFLFKNRGEGYN